MAGTGDGAILTGSLSEAVARYRWLHPKSAARHEEAARHMPGGNTRSVLYYPPFPLTWARGRGNRLTDIDGLEYLDLLGEYSAGLYGHSNPIIQSALKKAIDDGTVLGGPNVYEAQLAEAIRSRFPSIDLIRFTNSGTEANLMALSVVRAITPSRSRVLVFGGAYHGGVLYFREGAGPLNVPFDWLVGTYNEVAKTRALLRTHAQTISAVLVEPMQGGACIPGTAEFLTMLREECTRHHIVLIFDEVMTSRLSSAGLQGLLKITPDLTTFGKYLGGGSSFGAFGGKRDIMQRLDPSRADSFEHAGTFNNNVLSMAAGLAGLTKVFTPSEVTRINNLGDALRERLNAMAKARAAPLYATGCGSLIGLHFSGKESSVGQVETLFHVEMLNRGFYLASRGYMALSLPTTELDVERFAAAVEEFLVRYASE